MTAIDDVPCPECGRPFGIHTTIEYREHTAVHLDFEQTDAIIPESLTGQILVDHLDVAAVVMAVETQMAGVIHLPGVEFRFHSSDGRTVPPVVFVADDDRLFRDLGRMITAACGAAPMRAKQARRAAGGQP